MFHDNIKKISENFNNFNNLVGWKLEVGVAS